MQNTTTPPLHSGLGIASFVTSLAAGLVLLVMFGIAAALEAQHGAWDPDSTPAALIGLFVLLTTLGQICALGLGIAALVQAGRNKLFGVLGTISASCALFFTLVLILVGVVMEA